MKWELHVQQAPPVIYNTSDVAINVTMKNASAHPMTLKMVDAKCVLDGQTASPITPSERHLQPNAQIGYMFEVNGVDFSKHTITGRVDVCMLYRHAEDTEFRFQCKHGFGVIMTTVDEKNPGLERLIQFRDVGGLSITDL